MSRSFKKNKFACIFGKVSDKEDKIRANKKFRRVCKIYIKKRKDIIPTKVRELCNIYDFNSEGIMMYITKDKLKYWNKFLRK